MLYLSSIVVSVIVAELFVRLPVLVFCKALIEIITKTVATIRSPRISDHWKEKVLIHYAGMMALNTIKMGGILLIIFGSGFLVSSACELILDSKISPIKFLMTPIGVAVAAISASAYFFVRKRFVRH